MSRRSAIYVQEGGGGVGGLWRSVRGEPHAPPMDESHKVAQDILEGKDLKDSVNDRLEDGKTKVEQQALTRSIRK